MQARMPEQLNEELNLLPNTDVSSVARQVFDSVHFAAMSVFKFARENTGLTILFAASYLIGRNAPDYFHKVQPNHLPGAWPLLFSARLGTLRTINYKGIPATDISDIVMNCRSKIGGSDGCVCLAQGKVYYFKTLKSAQDNKNNDPFLGEYNRRFIGENIEIRVPNAGFVAYKKNNAFTFYSASEHVNNFQQADKHCQSLGDLSCIYSRKDIANLIGEKGVAQLAVVNTFIKDLHSLNWGIADNQLIIIDADKSPMSLHEYFTWSAERFQGAGMGTIGFSLSLDNIREMKSIYKKMLSKQLPVFHAQTDMSRETYTILLNAYIEVCTNTINETLVKLPNVLSLIPDPRINEFFSRSMANMARSKLALQVYAPSHAHQFSRKTI